jgi:hypothetical protein
MTAEQQPEAGHIIGHPIQGVGVGQGESGTGTPIIGRGPIDTVPPITSPVDKAYAALKELENSGQLTFPEPQDTVVVGTVDPSAGTFTWAVPTMSQTMTTPPPPGGRTNQVTNLTVGVVATNAVDLLLSFNVAPALPVNAPPVTITGVDPTDVFPTVTSAADQIVIDAGLAVSTAIIVESQTQPEPAISRFDLAISIPGQPVIPVSVFILRPPVLGIGAFTIEAMPVGVIYAPPQESSNQNFATFTQSQSVSRTVTTAISNGSSTKTTPAYTAADLISKAAGAITAVAAVVGTGGAAGVGGASVVGALTEFVTAIGGGAQAANDDTASATQALTGNLNLVSGILSGLDTSPQITSSDSLTVESDNSITLQHTEQTSYKTTPGKGPGIGDRIEYLYNVRAIWMVVNGEVGIHVLGAYATVADGADSLIAEKRNLESGGQPTLSPPLTLDGINTVLAADVMVDAPSSRFPVTTGTGNEVQPARVAGPRFLQANPPVASGTDADPDTIGVTVAKLTDDRQVTTTTNQTISDLKPGWAAVILGADNTDTTTTATLTTTQTVDVNTNNTTISTLTMFGSYNIVLYTDTLYSTYAALDPDSPLLQGPPRTIGGALS